MIRGLAALLLVLAAVGCGGGDDSEREAAGQRGEGAVETAGAAEPGRDDLKRLALTLDDLPPGTEIDEETFEDGAFTRDFILEEAIGDTEVAYVASEIELYDSAAEARVTATGAATILLGPEGKELFAQTFADEAGFSAENLEIARVEAPTYGDASGIVTGSFDIPAGGHTALFAYVAVDRVVGAVYALGPEEGFDARDLLPLVERQAERLRR